MCGECVCVCGCSLCQVPVLLRRRPLKWQRTRRTEGGGGGGVQTEEPLHLFACNMPLCQGGEVCWGALGLWATFSDPCPGVAEMTGASDVSSSIYFPQSDHHNILR